MSEKAITIGRFQVITNTYSHMQIRRAYLKVIWPRRERYVEEVKVKRYVNTNRWAFFKGGTAWQLDIHLIATFMVMVYHNGCSVRGVRFEVTVPRPMFFVRFS